MSKKKSKKDYKYRCPGCKGPANRNGWVHKKEPEGWTTCKYYGSPRPKN